MSLFDQIRNVRSQSPKAAKENADRQLTKHFFTFLTDIIESSAHERVDRMTAKRKAKLQEGADLEVALKRQSKDVSLRRLIVLNLKSDVLFRDDLMQKLTDAVLQSPKEVMHALSPGEKKALLDRTVERYFDAKVSWTPDDVFKDLAAVRGMAKVHLVSVKAVLKERVEETLEDAVQVDETVEDEQEEMPAVENGLLSLDFAEMNWLRAQRQVLAEIMAPGVIHWDYIEFMYPDLHTLYTRENGKPKRPVKPLADLLGLLVYACRQSKDATIRHWFHEHQVAFATLEKHIAEAIDAPFSYSDLEEKFVGMQREMLFLKTPRKRR